MRVRVVTTITTDVDIDTMETEHSTEIEADPGVPEVMARAAAIGGCRATLNALGEGEPEKS